MTTHTAACKALRYVAAFDCAGECQTFPPVPDWEQCRDCGGRVVTEAFAPVRTGYTRCTRCGHVFGGPR